MKDNTTQKLFTATIKVNAEKINSDTSNLMGWVGRIPKKKQLQKKRHKMGKEKNITTLSAK